MSYPTVAQKAEDRRQYHSATTKYDGIRATIQVVMLKCEADLMPANHIDRQHKALPLPSTLVL